MKTRRYKGGNVNVVHTDKISTLTTIDPGYKVVGILTHTENVGINAVRGMATGISNFFGKSGFELSRFNDAKKQGLQEIVSKLTATQKVIGLSIEVDNSPAMICIHFTGTVIQR
jgi:hypothetical protein